MAAVLHDVKSIFGKAVEMTSVRERADFVAEACGTDVVLRAEVEGLLAASDKAGPFMGKPASESATVGYQQANEAAGEQVGPFKLLQKLGEGGMGTVWVAEQEKPVKRRVAIKLIKAGMDTAQVLHRFEAERQALALMDHTNIAKVLDAGTSASGRPYFVMELVKGVPITKYCDEVHASIKNRLDLFVQVCSAVQHAHQKGIIHRDIKPSNILIAMQDGKPVPKVIDFGVAKALHSKLADQTMYTEIGQIIGTLEYMAPEQAELSAMDIDTRADIYALGVLLYELLTGSTPITRERMKSAAFAEVIRLIKEEDPPKPSTRLTLSKESLASLAALRKTDPKHLSAELKGELDWVVLKALEKDRTCRYETANGLARDIQRYLADEVVEARPPSAGYRLQKFVRRNKGKVLAASLIMLALLAGIAGTTWGLIRAERSAEAERLAKIDADEKREKAERAEQRERQAKERESSQRTKAEKAYTRTADVLDTMVSEVTSDSLVTQKEITAEQKKFLTEVLTYYREFAGEKADDTKTRLRTTLAAYRVGMIESRLGRMEESAAAFRKACDGYASLAAEFPAVPNYRLGLTVSHNNLGYRLVDLGKQPEAEEQFRKGLAIGEKLAAEFPGVPEHRQSLAGSHAGLGALLRHLGKRAEAEEKYRKALALFEKLATEFPAVPEYRQSLASIHNDLGNLLRDLGKLPEVEEQYNKGLAIREKLAADFPTVPRYRQYFAVSHYNLGNLLENLGKLPEAEEQYNKGLALQEKLVAEFPAVPEYRQELALSLGMLAGVKRRKGNLTAAEQLTRKELAIKEKLVADFPAVPQYRHNMASSLSGLGNLLTRLGKQPEADEQRRKGLAIQEKLVAEFPTVPVYREKLASYHSDLGMQLMGQGRLQEADEQSRKALAIKEKLAADFPAVPRYRVDLGGSYCNFGELLREGDKPSESLEWFDKAIGTLAPVHEREPRAVAAKIFLRNSYDGRARAYDRLQKYAEAVRDWDRAIELSPPAEKPWATANRTATRLRAGTAFDANKELTQLTTAVADASITAVWQLYQWYDVACAFSLASGKLPDKKDEYAKRAVELLQRAVKAGYTDAAHMKKDTDLAPLRDRDDFKKLMAELEKTPEPKK